MTVPTQSSASEKRKRFDLGFGDAVDLKAEAAAIGLRSTRICEAYLARISRGAIRGAVRLSPVFPLGGRGEVLRQHALNRLR